MDKDLEELLDGFAGYGVESWMRTSFVGVIQLVQKTRDAIREHRDEKGHDRCFLDDQKLYKTLPEAAEGDLALPCKEDFLVNCERYYEHRRDPIVTYLKQADCPDLVRGPEIPSTTQVLPGIYVSKTAKSIWIKKT